MPLESLDNRSGGKALVHKQRQGGHVKRQALGLAGPIKKRRRQRLQCLSIFTRCGEFFACLCEDILGFSAPFDGSGEAGLCAHEALRSSLRPAPVAGFCPSQSSAGDSEGS